MNYKIMSSVTLCNRYSKISGGIIVLVV